MNIAYAPILREQFNQLYRFGYTTIPVSVLVGTEYRVQPSQADCQRIAQKLTELSPFEYEEEYVILQLLYSAEDQTGLITLSIRDVQRIYPLNQRAKEFLESRLDPRIEFQMPVFESFIADQFTNRLWRDAEQAVRGLWECFGFSNVQQEAWELISKEEVQSGLRARLRGVKAHALKDEEYWAYVIAYDRYEVYPSHTLGYFYDAGQLYANKRGLPSFDTSGLYKVLESIRQAGNRVQFPQIKAELEQNELTAKYRDSTMFYASPREERLRAYLITPIFLLIKDQLRHSDNPAQTVLFKDVDFVRASLEDAEFKVLLTLLGCFFGYRKFYDVIYEHPPLHIFSNHLAPKGPAQDVSDAAALPPVTHKNGPNELDKVVHKNHVIESDNALSINEPAPVIMEKIKQLGDPIATPQPTTINLQEPDGTIPKITNVPQDLNIDQLPLSFVLRETDRPSKRGKKAVSKVAAKSDEELLSELVDVLSRPEYEGRRLLREVAAMFGRNGKETEILLNNDPRFMVSGGKSKEVVIVYTTE